MRLEGLEAFVAIAETGTISGAAKRLHLSTSVVSERLARLEQELGVALMHRTTRKLTLTEDGLTFRARAAAILREVESAAAELSERRGGLAGPLRLAAPLSFGVLHLGPAIYTFLHQHPRVDLTLDLDDRFVDVAGDGFDAVIRIGQVADRRVIAQQLAPSRRVLVASPAYLDRYGRPRSLDELQGHAVFNYMHRGAEDWRFRTSRGTDVIRIAPRLRVNNGDVMRGAAEAGLGLALLPTFLVADSVVGGRLEVLDIGAEAEIDVVHVAYAKAKGVPSKVAALVAGLRAAFGDPPYWDRAFVRRRST